MKKGEWLWMKGNLKQSLELEIWRKETEYTWKEIPTLDILRKEKKNKWKET